MRTIVAGSLLLLLGSAATAALSPEQARPWLQKLIPLPREIALARTVNVPAGGLTVTIIGADRGVIGTAAQQLRDAAGPVTQARFELRLGVCTADGKLSGWPLPGAERLRTLPNSGQAYAIAPLGDHGLALTGLTEQAVYYAAMTVLPWVQAAKPGEARTMPLASIVDWPDLAERGEWGGSAARDIELMSTLKLNLIEAHADLSLTGDGHGRAVMNPELLDRGWRHAVKVVPIITHLDQLGGTGLFERYPETIGQGETTRIKGTDVLAPCFSQPKTAEILADWMVSLATQPGVGTICIWLSENGAKCDCDRCRKDGQYTLETRACLRAWELAKAKNPAVQLRILLTQGSYPVNDKVLAELPPGVEVSYYDGGRTYDSSRDPMIYPLLTDYLKGGRWLGVYPQITASWRIVCPWSGPQFMKARMTEFVDKQLTCLVGYATPDNRLYDFNFGAAAEWSWHAHGRDERDYARAWATRRGLADPDKAADWAVTLGPVGWDVYGSGLPYPQLFGPAAQLIKSRRAPVLGKGAFRYFPTVEHFAEDAAAVARARQLAESLGAPALVTETQVIGGYLAMARKLYDLSSALSRPTPPTEAERRQMSRDLLDFSTAAHEVTVGLKGWEAACAGQGGSRLGDTLQITEQTVADVSKHLAPLGLRNPVLPYFRQKVGAWVDDDFEAKPSLRKSLDVTSQVSGPGTYEVTFVYTKGWHGLNMSRAALASAPADQPDRLTEVASDQHAGVAAYQNKANTYALKLTEYDPQRKYLLLVDITGVKSSDKPLNRRGCEGEVVMAKVREPGVPVEPLPPGPMAPAEAARYGGPKFATAGIHAVVVQGGYGSESLLAALGGREGLEAQPAWALTAAALKDVQVVIVPQPRAREALGAAQADVLTKYLRGGGGLILLHDAVGFRGLPVIAPEICAGAADKVKGQPAQAAGAHPVAAGLAGHALAVSYYDYLTLKPGPQATVVAAGAGGAPVVLAGEAGKGRCVACGLAPGLAAADDAETAPTADELALLLNAVRWAAGR